LGQWLSELFEKTLNLLRRELWKADDDLAFDETEVVLQLFDIPPEQLPEFSPGATIADCVRTELDDKLTRSGQPTVAARHSPQPSLRCCTVAPAWHLAGGRRAR
jgi:hypothetical protein